MAQNIPRGAVPLAGAIAALREELTQAWWDGRHSALRFKPSPVELTLQVGVTAAEKGSAGVKWWLIELGGEMSRESVVTQTLSLTLEPIMLDDNDQPLEFPIEAGEPPSSSEREADEDTLDAPG